MYFSKKITTSSEPLDTLLHELKQAKSDLDSAYSNFENVIDPDMIDSSIYQLNAIHLRYRFLLNRIKELKQVATLLRL